MTIYIYTDGACEPNPGVGGWSFVIYENGNEIVSRYGGHHDTTNNIMEMTGVLCALEYASMTGFDASQTVIRSDSQYVVKGVMEWRHGWKRKGWKRGKWALANADLWKAIDEAHIAFPAHVEWVRGHVGDIGNERADELAGIGRAYITDIALRPDLYDGMKEAAE